MRLEPDWFIWSEINFKFCLLFSALFDLYFLFFTFSFPSSSTFYRLPSSLLLPFLCPFYLFHSFFYIFILKIHSCYFFFFYLYGLNFFTCKPCFTFFPFPLLFLLFLFFAFFHSSTLHPSLSFFLPFLLPSSFSFVFPAYILPSFLLNFLFYPCTFQQPFPFFFLLPSLLSSLASSFFPSMPHSLSFIQPPLQHFSFLPFLRIFPKRFFHSLVVRDTLIKQPACLFAGLSVCVCVCEYTVYIQCVCVSPTVHLLEHQETWRVFTVTHTNTRLLLQLFSTHQSVNQKEANRRRESSGEAEHTRPDQCVSQLSFVLTPDVDHLCSLWSGSCRGLKGRFANLVSCMTSLTDKVG